MGAFPDLIETHRVTRTAQRRFSIDCDAQCGALPSQPQKLWETDEISREDAAFSFVSQLAFGGSPSHCCRFVQRTCWSKTMESRMAALAERKPIRIGEDLRSAFDDSGK